MTEIPEHLLKRSKDRRAAAGGAAAESGDTPSAPVPATPSAAAAPAKAPAKAAVPALPPPPKPDPAYVAAAKSRKKIPFWAMATLSLLPIWGFMYVQGVKPQAQALSGPLAEGDHVYSGCAACHGAAGGGGSGRAFTNGEVLKTFPRIEDQINFVYNGTDKYKLAGLATYGDPNREGGARVPGSFGGAMPQQGAKAGGGLSDIEVLGVVCHERYILGGADPASEEWAQEYELWCSPEAPIFIALEEGATFDELHEEFAEEGVILVGTTPRLGTSAES